MTPPPSFDGPGFRLEPIGPHLEALDYEAVMASQELLHRWSGSPWPEDSFTRQENIEDLKEHEEEHRQGIAYGYAILSPQGERVLGSIYINPEVDWVGDYGLENLSAVAGFDLKVEMWVRPDAPGVEDALLATLPRWFEDGWGRKALFPCREAHHERGRALKRAGYEHVITLRSLERGLVSQVYRAP